MTLQCIACSRRHPLEASLCACGGPLDLSEPPALPDPEQWSGRGVWRYSQALPVTRDRAVTLGEGGTPIRVTPSISASAKLEYLSPTGSFKDRGATVVVSYAKALGAKRVVEDSSGNAGAAIAAYAARAGLAAHIVAPASILEAKSRAIEELGATLERVEGERARVTARAVELAREPGSYYASHVMTPWFALGTKTAAYEIFEEAGPGAFDCIVTPAGNGTLLLGLARGFADLVRAGLEESVPRLVAVQPSGFSPLVDALEGAGPTVPPNPIADGAQIAKPPRLVQLATAVRESGGASVRASDAQTRQALRRLHSEGLDVEPTSALALAGLETLRAGKSDVVEGKVLLMLTGRSKGPLP